MQTVVACRHASTWAFMYETRVRNTCTKHTCKATLLDMTCMQDAESAHDALLSTSFPQLGTHFLKLDDTIDGYTAYQ